MKQVRDEDYTSIIPTAYLTAYPQTYTDIPYSNEVFGYLEQLRRERNLPELGTDQKIPRLAPELEARHKLIDKLLKETKITQYLELAAGLSTRGMVMSDDPNIRYAELDLPEMAELKQQIVSKIKEIPPNLNIVAGNALRLSDIDKAVSDFDSNKPVAVINEGLLRYLSFSEKAQVANNVHSLLEKQGGVWITCDTTPKKFLATQDSVTRPGMNQNLKDMTGKNLDDNIFEDQVHYSKFFGDLGFSVEVHPFSEIEGELYSPNGLHFSKEEVKKLLGPAVVVVMRIK